MMDSFIDLMGNDRWSGVDISNRFKALRDSQMPQDKQLMYTQIMLAGVARQRTVTAEEASKIAAFTQLGAQLDTLAVTVYTQAALLNAVLDFEQGVTAEPLTGDALALYEARVLSRQGA
jgi:hypothetical protein